MICDFCSAPDPTWKYPAKDFPVEDLPVTSEGAWAACDVCAGLIENRDKDELLERSVRRFPLLELMGREGAVKATRKLHRQFFQSRSGGAERIRIETVN